MTERSYGKISLKKDFWILEGEPHIAILWKRMFPQALRTDGGALKMSDNDATRRNIEWFVSRYTLTIEEDDRKAIKKGAKRHEDTILRLEQMIDKDYKPLDVRLALPPRNYQKIAAEIALKKGSLLLADDVGLGKSCSGICTLSAAWTLPAVVVTLAGAMPQQWQEEIAKFMPQLFTHVVKRGTSYELPKRDGRGPDVVILNYHKLSGWDNVLKAYAKSVIFDEAQELRHSGSAKYISAKNLADAMRLKLGLSATPIFNYGGEIYNVIQVLDPDALGTPDEFFRTWCSGSYRDHSIVRDPKALGSYLRENFIMLRRTRKDVGRELPPLQKIPQHIESDPAELDKIHDSAAVLAKIILSNEKREEGEVMRAGGQLSVMLRQATGVSKAPYVADFIRLLVESGEKVLCFLFHREVYDIINSKLEDLKPAMFTGSETPAEKIESRRRFIAGETPVLLMSLRSGAGLDGLQKVCRTVVFGELDWAPAIHEQCLSMDTEILSENGWIKSHEAVVGRNVAAFDIKTGDVKWVPILRKIDRPVGSGEKMYGTRTEKIDVRVTGRHRMVVRRKKRSLLGVGRSSWGFDLAEDLVGKKRRYVPTSGYQDAKGVPLNDYQLRLIGMYLADGSFNGKTLTIYQEASQPWNLDIIDMLRGSGIEWSLLQRRNPTGAHMNMYSVGSGSRYHWSADETNQLQTLLAQGKSYKEIGVSVGRSAVATYKKSRRAEIEPVATSHGCGWKTLEPYLDKDLSATLEDVTREQLRQLIHGFWLGDGAKSPELKVIKITNTNRVLVDRFQSLCVRRGFSANISTRSSKTVSGKSIYDLWISDSLEASVPEKGKPNALSEVPSNPGETVWCVTNELQTIITRRNGKVSILGNCVGRVFRDGQTDPVTAYFLVADDGADPLIAEKLGLKRQQAEGIRNPDQEILEDLQVDQGRAIELAKFFLKKRQIPEPVEGQ